MKGTNRLIIFRTSRKIREKHFQNTIVKRTSLILNILQEVNKIQIDMLRVIEATIISKMLTNMLLVRMYNILVNSMSNKTMNFNMISQSQG